MSTIKITKKVKKVRLQYPSREQRRRGDTHRDEVTYDAAVRGMVPSDRVVVLHLGELNDIVKGLTLHAMALELRSGQKTYDVNCLEQLRNRLQKLGSEQLEPATVWCQACGSPHPADRSCGCTDNGSQ